MCNLKGWDLTFGAAGVSVEPHFCRVYGDCGSVDRSLSDAAEEVAKYYDDIAQRWRDGTHPDLVWYRDSAWEQDGAHPDQ